MPLTTTISPQVNLNATDTTDNSQNVNPVKTYPDNVYAGIIKLLPGKLYTFQNDISASIFQVNGFEALYKNVTKELGHELVLHTTDQGLIEVMDPNDHTKVLGELQSNAMY